MSSFVSAVTQYHRSGATSDEQEELEYKKNVNPLSQEQLQVLTQVNIQDELHSFINDWHETMKVFSERSAKLEQSLNEQAEEMEYAKVRYVALQTKMNRARKNLKDKIRLNIGGTVFVTSLDTMTLEKNTFFSAMFSEEFHQQPDDDGEYYVDRDPTYFRIILNHLRGVDIKNAFSSKNQWERSLIQQEIEFYQIESLKPLVGLRKSLPGYDNREFKKNLLTSHNIAQSQQCSVFVDKITGKAYHGIGYMNQQLYEYESLDDLIARCGNEKQIELSGGYRGTYLCAYGGLIYAATTTGFASYNTSGVEQARGTIPHATFQNATLDWGGKSFVSRSNFC
jgi:hypothetical protein